MNYITGLKWTFDYYYKGCSNWTWKYNYRHSPTLKDLANVINQIDINNIKLKKNKPFNVVVQLLSIFPYNSKKLIPEKFRSLMESNSDIADYYPDGFELDCYYKRYYWMCEPILPIINFDRIQECVKKIKLSRLEQEELYKGQLYYKTKES